MINTKDDALAYLASLQSDNGDYIDDLKSAGATKVPDYRPYLRKNAEDDSEDTGFAEPLFCRRLFSEVNPEKWIARTLNIPVASVSESKSALPKIIVDDAFAMFVRTNPRNVTESTIGCYHVTYNNNIKPEFGNKNFADITPEQLSAKAQDLIDEGKIKTAHDFMALMRLMSWYLKNRGFLINNPADGLNADLTPRDHKNAPVITSPKALGKLYHNINNYSGSSVVGDALQFLLLTQARVGEVVGARWDEMDLEQKIWHLPKARTKQSADVDIYLSKQAVAILERRKAANQGEPFVFGKKSKLTPTTTAALALALKSMGYGPGIFTPHSARGTMVTVMHETKKVPIHILDSMLGHKAGSVERAYNHANYIQQKRTAQQAYADYLEELANNYAQTL